MDQFWILFGRFAAGATLILFFYGIGKWVLAKLRNRTDRASRTVVVVVNSFTTIMERTVIVPYVVEKVVEKTVPIIVPQSPTKPTRPTVPEWLRPERPQPHRPETLEGRPAYHPRRPFDRPGRRIETGQPQPRESHRRADVADFFDGGNRPGPTYGGREPHSREGRGYGSFGGEG